MPPRNSAGFCGGGQGLSWAVEPRKEEEEDIISSLGWCHCYSQLRSQCRKVSIRAGTFAGYKQRMQRVCHIVSRFVDIVPVTFKYIIC
jgi:hypothetical protein